MSDNGDDTNLWEFMAIVKAALYAAKDEDEAKDAFVDTTWETYQVIERRIRDSETDALLAVPEVNKEAAVRRIAEEKFEEGITEEALETWKRHYLVVPSGTSKRRMERWRRLQNRRDLYDDLYDWDG